MSIASQVSERDDYPVSESTGYQVVERRVGGQVVQNTPGYQEITSAPACQIVQAARCGQMMANTPACKVITSSPGCQVVQMAGCGQVITKTTGCQVITSSPGCQFVQMAGCGQVITNTTCCQIVGNTACDKQHSVVEMPLSPACAASDRVKSTEGPSPHTDRPTPSSAETSNVKFKSSRPYALLRFVGLTLYVATCLVSPISMIVVGNVWIFRISGEVSYEPTSNKYCHKTLYEFSVVLTNAVYTVLGVYCGLFLVWCAASLMGEGH
ncbi:uncharacterized protein LOC131938918 [Physella acuta]|uniref:uncharacterized protein LOC131938918 n=1 Tax=Physella acuta TaxID=109671 RepID=UPI0027DC6B8C|nr:uncharacterized protein LOC131938918 [Physella acuta]